MIITDSLVKILAYLYQKQDKKVYSSIIAKETDKTQSYVVKLMNDLNKSGLIEKNKLGRKVLLKLTDRGLKVAEHCNNLVNSLKR